MDRFARASARERRLRGPPVGRRVVGARERAVRQQDFAPNALADTASECRDDEERETDPNSRDDPRYEPQIGDAADATHKRGDPRTDPIQQGGNAGERGPGALGRAEDVAEPGVGDRGVDAALRRAIGRGDISIDDRERRVRPVGSREHICDGAIVDRYGFPTILDGGRLPQKGDRLREHALAVERPRGSRPVNERADLREARAVCVERQRVRRGARGDGDPENEAQDESAS